MNIQKLELTPENLRMWRQTFLPIGSGPLSVMHMVVGLIDAIARDKGWDVSADAPSLTPPVTPAGIDVGALLDKVYLWAKQVEEDAGRGGSHTYKGREIRDMVDVYRQALKGIVPVEFIRYASLWDSHELERKNSERKQAEANERARQQLPQKIASTRASINGLKKELAQAQEQEHWKNVERISTKLQQMQQRLQQLEASKGA